MYAEAPHQVLARWHFSARQSLRAIVRYTATARGGTVIDQATTGSLTWAWRQSAGTVLYLGATRSRDGLGPGVQRRNEAFVKLRVDADELRRAWSCRRGRQPTAGWAWHSQPPNHRSRRPP